MRKCLLLLLLAVGCTHAKPKPVVWPDPPDTPRIRFVRAIRSGDDLDQSGWGKVKRVLLGNDTDTTLAQPMGLALSKDGQRLYVADQIRGHVFVVDLADNSMRPFAPEEPMGSPFTVALDGQENVYISDGSSRSVLVFSKTGQRLAAIGLGKLVRPTGLAVDELRSLLYVADTANRDAPDHLVRVYRLDGTHVRDLGHGKGKEPGQFYFPVYLALDGAGNLYVGDTMNFRVQVFSPEGEHKKSFGEAGDGPGTFNKLKGLAFDGFGNLYAVDGGHSNVQILNRDFQVLMYFGGYASKLEYFDVPSGIAVDPKRNLIYVCNEYVARINVYELINTTAADTGGKPPEPKGEDSSPADVTRVGPK